MCLTFIVRGCARALSKRMKLNIPPSLFISPRLCINVRPPVAVKWQLNDVIVEIVAHHLYEKCVRGMRAEIS